MAEEGRPTFDLSSFSTFNFPATGQASLPGETTEVAEGSSNKTQAQQEDFFSSKNESPRISQVVELVDLVKYGPPAALAKLNQTVAMTILAVIRDSIDNVRAQVDTETEIRHHQDQTRGQNPQAEQPHRVSDGNAGNINKGKGLDAPRVTPVSGPASSIASDQTDSASFYTPSEGGQSPSADEHVSTETGISIAEDSSPYFTPMPRLKASSTSAIPRRRDLIKSMIQGMSDTDTRRHVLRRSTGALQLKAKLKHAKQIWQGEAQMGECISCFDDFAAKEPVRLRCHNYCRPCFRLLITHAIETEATWPPKCCLHPIEHRKCLKNISGSLEKEYRQKRREYMTPIEQRYYCPIADCGVFVPPDGKNIKELSHLQQRCSRNHLTCVECRGWAHSDAIQCPKNKEMGTVQQLAVEEGWRRCYRCKTMIEHQSACRHMTCRCGAEFCYVCGKVWWTCGCTERQLDRVKRAAKVNAARRLAQEEREKDEAQQLRQALEIIAKIEAEAAEKQERVRVAKETCRKSQVQYTYACHKTTIEELNEFQRGLLDGDHQRDQAHLTLKTLEAMDGLRVKHGAKMRLLEESSKTKIEEKRWELDQQRVDRIAQEYRADTSWEVQLTDWGEQAKNSDLREQGLLDSQNSRQEQGRKACLNRNNDTLERLRYVLNEEVSIEQELMDAKKDRIRESFKIQERELQVKIRSQLRWLELVSTERSRLLEEFMAVELADEVKDDDDDRWNSILVREEAGKAGPSRFQSASRNVRGLAPFLDRAEDEAGPSSERLEVITREPTPSPWNPLPLGSALHAAWDSAWDAYCNPLEESEVSGQQHPAYSTHANTSQSFLPLQPL